MISREVLVDVEMRAHHSQELIDLLFRDLYIGSENRQSYSGAIVGSATTPLRVKRLQDEEAKRTTKEKRLDPKPVAEPVQPTYPDPPPAVAPAKIRRQPTKKHPMTTMTVIVPMKRDALARYSTTYETVPKDHWRPR